MALSIIVHPAIVGPRPHRDGGSSAPRADRLRRAARELPGRDPRRAALRVLGVCAVSLAGLSACAIQPVPLTPEQTGERIEADRERLQANRPVLDGPLTVHGAMARALLHNLDARVAVMEQALALRQTDVAHLGLLPRMTGRYGANSRNNIRASTSRNLRGPPSSGLPSTSTDDTYRSGNLSVVWNVLDLGVSWHAAKQQSDRALIAHERRRKAIHAIVQDVRRAWWRAVAAERALATVEPLMVRVDAALADSARIAKRQARAPLEALRYQSGLLEALQTLEAQQREGRLAMLELAALIGLPPGTPYRLALPDEAALVPRVPALDVEALEILALSYRPELREEQLNERIAAAEVKKALLRVLPGIELTAGAHVDSNSYLVNNNWAALGAAVSANLSKVFTAPAALGAARAHRDVARARREALSMAVLTQLYVALAGYEEARAQHATASRIAQIRQRIAEVLRASGQRAVVGELEVIHGEIDALRAVLARDLRFAEVEDGFGRIFVATGADIAADGPGALTPETLAQRIAATEAAWMRGEVEMWPWREARAH